MVGFVGTSVKLRGLVFDFLQLGVNVEELGGGDVLGLFAEDSSKSGDAHPVDVFLRELFENELAEGLFHFLGTLIRFYEDPFKIRSKIIKLTDVVIMLIGVEELISKKQKQ